MILDQAKMNLASQHIWKLSRNYFEPCMLLGYSFKPGPGYKKSQFYSLTFMQAVTSMYYPKSNLKSPQLFIYHSGKLHVRIEYPGPIVKSTSLGLLDTTFFVRTCYSGFTFDHHFINERDSRNEKKNSFTIENKLTQVWKFGLQWPQGLDTIQTEPTFLFFTQEGKMRHCLQGAAGDLKKNKYSKYDMV